MTLPAWAPNRLIQAVGRLDYPHLPSWVRGDDLPALPGAKPRDRSRGDRDANPGEQRGRLRFAKAHGFLEVEAYLLPGGTIPFVELRLDR
jgi:hypothetical protein